jgi:hypothetical protein
LRKAGIAVGDDDRCFSPVCICWENGCTTNTTWSAELIARGYTPDLRLFPGAKALIASPASVDRQNNIDHELQFVTNGYSALSESQSDEERQRDMHLEKA